MPAPFIRAWLLVLLAVSAYIRVHGAGDYHFSNDEAMVFNVAHGRTLPEVLGFSLYEVHPPALYLLLHYWLMVSDNPAFARGFSLVFGLLAILLHYRIGRLLNGELTGMTAAALVAFSQGWIIQSYLLRQYALFLFLLSCALYCFFEWRHTRKSAWLLAYGGFACLACLTHFSGILAVFCLGLWQALYSWRRRPVGKTAAVWVLANLPALLVTATAYYFWQPSLLCVKSYIGASLKALPAGSAASALEYGLFYPVELFLYLCSTPLEALILLVLLPVAGWKIPALRPMMLLAFLALALGAVLGASHIYSIASARHYMWSFPLIVPALAWAICQMGRACCNIFFTASPVALESGFAVFLLIAGMAMYDPAARYADGLEYQIPEQQWQSFSRYADTLGPDDLIIANVDDAMSLRDTYPYLPRVPCVSSFDATAVPFRRTRILFSSTHRRYYDPDFIVSLLEEAQARGMLEGVARLVFYQTQWARTVEPDWTLCPVSGKDVISFPTGDKNNAGDFYARVMTVPKDMFMIQAILPTASARRCLAFKYGVAPDAASSQHGN